MPERWLSVDEIAAHLRANPDTLYKRVIRKRLTAHKLARVWKLLASELEWIQGGLSALDTGRRTEVAAKKRKSTAT